MGVDALIIGVTGQVGGALRERLGADRVVGTSQSGDSQAEFRLDLEELATEGSSLDSMFAASPRWVFIAAGWTWVDGCEDDPEKAMRINRDAPAKIAKAARAHGARTIYYSTEYVFDGVGGPFDEDHETKPLGVYAVSKLRGEEAVLDEDPDALILRTTVVFGPEAKGKNFAYRLASTLSAGEEIVVPSDQISSPTYNRDLATASVQLAEAGLGGVFNVVGPQAMDRAEFSRRIAAALDLDASLIKPILTADMNQRAVRPLAAGLKIDKLRAQLPELKLRTVEEAVADWLQHPRGKAWPG